MVRRFVRRMHYHVSFARDGGGGWLTRSDHAEGLLFGAIEESVGLPRAWAEFILRQQGGRIDFEGLSVTGDMKECLTDQD
jgi:hypothetical protein